MFKINVKLTGLDKGQVLTKEKAKRVLFKCMFKMEELAVDKAPVNQGFLRANISLFPQLLSENYVLISKANYSAAMEDGTRPYWAPIEPLQEWARQKLGDESIGYAIQAKIAKYGIRAHPFMRPAFYEVVNFWYDQFAADEFKE